MERAVNFSKRDIPALDFTQSQMDFLALRLRIHPAVSERVKLRLERVRKLVKLSSYDYELLDVAVEYVLLSIESILREKYGREMILQEKLGLRNLLEWAKDKSTCPPDEGLIEAICYFRNVFAHEGRAIVVRGVNYKLIEDSMNFLYGLYEFSNTCIKDEKKKSRSC